MFTDLKMFTLCLIHSLQNFRITFVCIVLIIHKLTFFYFDKCFESN